ncbi:MAG: hypothetical protein MR390_02750 [Oscillospiraceae bacterium]|nr:hypothetical protein [Oscillospiraceae bacterium]
MTFDEFLEFIGQKIAPYTLSEVGEINMAVIYDNYSMELILECVEIGMSRYIKYNESGVPIPDSVQNFVNKLGGIVHNKSLNCIEREVNHIKSAGRNAFTMWKNRQAESILSDYVEALKSLSRTDEQIASDLKKNVLSLVSRCDSWVQWSEAMCSRIDDIERWNRLDEILGGVYTAQLIPDEIYNSADEYVRSLCRQINVCFELKLYDCVAAVMRKLLETLIIGTYRRFHIDCDITQKGGMYYVSLERMILNIRRNTQINIDEDIKNLLFDFINFGLNEVRSFAFLTSDRAVAPEAYKFNKIVGYFINLNNSE